MRVSCAQNLTRISKIIKTKHISCSSNCKIISLLSTKMDFALEEKRALHEERDRIEMEIVAEILTKKVSHKDRLVSEHRQKHLLDKYMQCSANLLSLYNREPIKKALDNSGFQSQKLEFTDEEGYGRYLDLTKCHEAYLQIIKKEETKPNYLQFLDKFAQFTDFEREHKLTSVYKIYVEMLLEYFRDYCRRAKPLFDANNMENKVTEDFNKQWQNKSVPGWFNESDKTQSVGVSMIDLESYKSVDRLMELGLDCLKQELQVRGLKCGGTLAERAERLWSIRGKKQEEIGQLTETSVSKKRKKRNTIDQMSIALIEAKLSMYAEYFNDHRLATIENVQRKQARTAEERVESDEDISDVEEEDGNQSEVIYNPKNLPLGWDGKPIPYWLYKLHGLNITFTCEICGNATYKGPKTFQRHFAEWRHAHGMSCLGIPNTAHFANITKIQDAISLWNKLKNERQKDKFQPLNEEEYEDSQGNVVNRKTYEDLKRQGLL